MSVFNKKISRMCSLVQEVGIYIFLKKMHSFHFLTYLCSDSIQNASEMRSGHTHESLSVCHVFALQPWLCVCGLTPRGGREK